MRTLFTSAAFVLLLPGFASAEPVTHDAAFTIAGETTLGNFASSISTLGDLNGDGVNDFIVGAPDSVGPGGIAVGRATIFSGADGSVIREHFGDGEDDDFGRSVAGIGDVDRDGVADFAVGAPFDDNTGSRSGTVTVYSGASGTSLFSVNGVD